LQFLAAFRALSIIPVPGVETSQLANFFAGNQLLGLLNVFTGGNLAQLSIMMLGVGPYITCKHHHAVDDDHHSKIEINVSGRRRIWPKEIWFIHPNAYGAIGYYSRLEFYYSP
jgi:hypothetical protein